MNVKTSEDIFNEFSPSKGNFGKCDIKNCTDNMRKTYIEIMLTKCKNINDPNCEKNINNWMNNYVSGEGYWPEKTYIPPKKDIYFGLKIFITILLILFLIFILSIISFLVSNKKMKM
jgi:hypothetical protein